MTDPALRASLERLVPEPSLAPDWADVRRRVGRTRRPLAVLALVAAALVLGATALAETLGHGFSEWLTGDPGRPASADERAEFRATNEASAAPFPAETDLRELLRVEHEGKTYRLLGFRTGAAVCLKVAGVDPDEGGDVACVAADELAESRELALPLVVDKPLQDLRPGDPPSDVVTYGLVAAEARRVILDGDDGERDAVVADGGFLAIGPGPTTEHTTLRAFAVDATGARRPVPLAPSLTVEQDHFDTGLPLLGPDRVERRVSGGTIGWLARGEPRGAPVPPQLRARMPRPTPRPADWPEGMPFLGAPAAGGFARVIQPDPADFLRVMLAQGAREGEVCWYSVSRGGVGGSCADPAAAFGDLPFTPGWTYAGAGSQFISVQGIATDDVARLELFLGTGERRRVALRDNAFVARVHRATMPARLVAYDREGRVIGIATQRSL
jgi:hypothetical protein